MGKKDFNIISANFVKAETCLSTQGSTPKTTASNL